MVPYVIEYLHGYWNHAFEEHLITWENAHNIHFLKSKGIYIEYDLNIFKTYVQKGRRKCINVLTITLSWRFFFFVVAPVAYGSSLASGWNGAAAAGLHHSHNNTGSKLHLRPAPQLVAMPDPEPPEQGQGWNPHPHGHDVEFLTLWAAARTMRTFTPKIHMRRFIIRKVNTHKTQWFWSKYEYVHSNLLWTQDPGPVQECSSL